MNLKKWLFEIACIVDPDYLEEREHIIINERPYPLRHWMISSDSEKVGSFIKVYGPAPGFITAIVKLTPDSECYVDVPADVLKKAKSLSLE